MPQIKIISPSQGQTILGDKVTVSFITGDFTVGQDGYINLWLDDLNEETSTAAKITGNFAYTLADLPPGPHRLTLETVRRNNLSFNPAVKQTISFSTSAIYTPTITPSPTPFNIFSFANSINWQYISIISALIIIAVGVFIKSKWGKPKIWK